MVIDKIGNINNIVEPKSTKSVSKSKEIKKNDKVEISSEAKQAAETARYIQIVKDTPDIARAERVLEIKNQIKNGTYDKFDNDQVLEMVADRIASYLIKK
jgi:anti-sigma28 factor (negative regulator of flagellin synthesis)